MNHEIKVGGRKVTMARARREGSPKPHPSSEKGKASMKHSSPIRAKSACFSKDGLKNSGGFVKSFEEVLLRKYVNSSIVGQDGRGS